jgi:hypothetical protein
MLRHCFRVAVLIIVALGVQITTADAQTTAVGPYYATPAWDQTLAPNARWIILSNMGSAAVLDRETGLVWERDPSAKFPFFGQFQSWSNAADLCRQLRLGNRKGWRLPTIEELMSLVTGEDVLPAGHPFQNIVTTGFSAYWSVSRTPGGSFAFVHGLGDPTTGSASLDNPNPYICVRGGIGASAFN